MRKLRNLLILVAVLAVAGYLTNPTSEDFNAWMKVKAKDKLDGREENGLFGGALNELFGNVLGSVGSATTTRQELHLASLYTVDLGEKEYRYLGVFTTFIPLQMSDPITDMLGKPEGDE